MSTSWFDTARRFRDAGNSVLPANAQKYPALESWDEYQQRQPTDNELQRWAQSGHTRHGLVTGTVSGGREMMDFDNKLECIAAGCGADVVFAVWCATVEEEAPDLTKRLTIEKTPSGGIHTHHRCAVIEKNRKLARYCSNPAAEPRDRQVLVLIETRGEGGFTVVSPTSGYTLRQGDIAEPAVITPEERDILFRAACALNHFVEPERVRGETRVRQLPGDGERPGDDYNRRATCDEILDILERAGWAVVRRERDRFRLRRPGKSEGQSATLFTDPCVFYCFTSNGYPFEQEQAYAPFGVLTELDRGGDYMTAALTLRWQGYGKQPDLASVTITGEADGALLYAPYTHPPGPLRFSALTPKMRDILLGGAPSGYASEFAMEQALITALVGRGAYNDDEIYALIRASRCGEQMHARYSGDLRNRLIYGIASAHEFIESQREPALDTSLHAQETANDGPSPWLAARAATAEEYAQWLS